MLMYIYLAEGFEETEMIAPLDLCRRAGIDAKTVSVTGNICVTGSHGITIKADMLASDAEYTPDKADIVMLPGGLPGTNGLEASDAVQNAIHKAFDGGKLVCAICAAPSVLGKAGLLQGKKATCYPGFEKYLYGATPVSEKVVRDGNVITGIGMGAAVQFGLEIVSAMCGEETAEKLKNGIIA